MKKAVYKNGSYEVAVDIDYDNYYNAEAIIARPGQSLALAVATPLLIGCHTLFSYVIGTVAAAVLGIDEVPYCKELAVAGTFVGSQYAMGMLSSDMLNTTTLKGLHDAYRFTEELTVAAIGEAYNSCLGVE